MNIDEIRSLSYDAAQKIAIETIKIKEHDCIFTDLGDYFGYSVLIFKNGKHIYYADDYELHHKYISKKQGREALRDFYIEEMKNKLYTEAELLEDVKTYDEYKKKDYFLRNYWIMRYEHLSIFGIGEEDKREFENAKPNFPFYSPVSFCYVANKEIINIQTKYSEYLENAYKKLKTNNEVFREMISHELANHEACITCDYTDALQALGMEFEELTETQQKIVNEELKKQINSYCC